MDILRNSSTDRMTTPDFDSGTGHAADQPVFESMFMFVIFDAVFYAMFIPVAFGVPGNLLAALVAGMSHNRKYTTSVYMLGLAIPDAIILIQQGMAAPLWRNKLGWYWPSREMETTFYYYLTFTSSMISGLVLAEMSIDRFLAIRFPMIAKGYCTVTKARVLVLITAVFVIATNISTFYCHDLTIDNASGVELLIVNVPEHPELEILFTGFQLVFGSILPSAIIITSNIGIILAVRQSSKKREQMGVQKGLDDEKRENQLTRMLIIVSIAYLITTIPHRLFYTVFEIPALQKMYDLRQPYWNILYNIEVILVFDIWMCNPAVNFYLYCLAGGKRYREDTKTVLRKFFCCSKGTKQ